MHINCNIFDLFQINHDSEVYDMELSLVEGSLIDGTIEGHLNVSTNVEVSSTPIKSRAILVREVSRKLKRCLSKICHPLMPWDDRESQLSFTNISRNN